MKKIFFIMVILLFSEFVWGQENRDTVQSDTLSVIQDVIELNNNDEIYKANTYNPPTANNSNNELL